jgi:hypothetical protein
MIDNARGLSAFLDTALPETVFDTRSLFAQSSHLNKRSNSTTSNTGWSLEAKIGLGVGVPSIILAGIAIWAAFSYCECSLCSGRRTSVYSASSSPNTTSLRCSAGIKPSSDYSLPSYPSRAYTSSPPQSRSTLTTTRGNYESESLDAIARRAFAMRRGPVDESEFTQVLYHNTGRSYQAASWRSGDTSARVSRAYSPQSGIQYDVNYESPSQSATARYTTRYPGADRFARMLE